MTKQTDDKFIRTDFKNYMTPEETLTTTYKQTDKWEETFDKKFNDVEFLHNVPVRMPIKTKKEIKQFIKQTLKSQECKKCYGKGYRTELKGRRDIGNIEDGSTYSENSGKQIGSFIEKEFCDCNIGKALKSQEEDFKKVLREMKDKKFPIGERKWCKECVNRITNEIISIIKKNNIKI